MICHKQNDPEPVWFQESKDIHNGIYILLNCLNFSSFKIIDDDVDYTKLRPLDDDELDLLNFGEDAPQIAGVIDERPEQIRKMEEFKQSSKWRTVDQVCCFLY